MINNKNKKVAIIYCLSIIVLCSNPLVYAEEPNEALNLSVEDLLNTEVTSVAKKAQSLNDAPAAAFVISNEDIKRSGATSIPDALRLAPGLDVAKIDANKWAVSSRGFNGRNANKLLVLIDGRSAYTRTFGGVYWENQDVMLEDIDRIEVIRGPGASLWGANAVNGVINIITKHSSQTQGALLNAGGGTRERDFGSFRYGAKLGEDTTARAYVKGFNRDQNTHLSGDKAGDNWNKVQGGFRMDSHLNIKDALTIQGDIYKTHINESAYYPQITSPYQITGTENNNDFGANLLSRLQHTFSPTSNYSLQFYYDTYSRNEFTNLERRDTLDLDFQHRFALLDWHDIVWGLNYRFGHDRVGGKTLPNGSVLYTANPTNVNDQVYSSFIQDELTLIDNKLWLTMGSKFEHNDYSGFEGQPSARIMWAPYNQHRLWAGVSRAVRTPTRSDQHIASLINVIPPQDTLSPPVALTSFPNPNLHSERVVSYEAGYRTTVSKSASLDVTGFYNNYHDLRNETTGTPFFNGTSLIMPINYSNSRQGRTYGVEIATVWQMLDWWRWDTNYTWLHTQFSDVNNMPSVSPQQQVSLRSALSPWQDIDLDFWFRYTDSAFAIGTVSDTTIKGYVTLDTRVAWHLNKNIELSLVGQNLLAEKHLEYVQEYKAFPTAIDRGMYGKVSWHF